jgi:hypothetical protein
LTQALGKVRDLTGQLAELETTYESEATGLRKLVTMMEEREARQKESVEAIEKDWAGVGEKAERREAALKEEIEKEKRAKEDARRKVEQLESVLDRVGRGELPVPGRSPLAPSRTATPDPTIDGMMGLSPTVAMASKAQRAGKTFTEVYADYVRLQDDYAKKLVEYDHMDRTLADVLAQIEERVRFCHSMSGGNADNVFRHLFFRSNASNTSVFNLKLLNWLRNSPRHLLTAIITIPTLGRRRRSSKKAPRRTNCSKSNLTILADKFNIC